jgi:hypothetical protein
VQSVIVTVKHRDQADARDLEVPADVEIAGLAGLLAATFGWDQDRPGRPVHYQIAAHPLGRTLRPEESLAAAGVWDGAWLMFEPIGTGAFAPGPLVALTGDQPAGGPVTGWRALGGAASAVGSSATPAGADPGVGFVWNQLDD